MKTRVFKNRKSENQELVAYTNDEIITKYNTYGFFLQDEDFLVNLQEYREERNESFQEWKEENTSYTLFQVKEFLKEFLEEYEYYPEGYSSLYGRPTKLFVYEYQDDCYKSFDEIEGKFFNEDGSLVKEPDLYDYIEVYKFWDGSNWQEIILTNEYGYCYYDEVTDEYPNWDGMENIHHNPQNTGHSNLYLYEDEEGKKYILEDVSYYQGIENTYEDLSDCQLTEYILLNPDVISEIPESEQLLQDYFAADLLKGEKIVLDDNEVAFKFKGELYHFSDKELKAEANDYKCGYAIKRARKALKERRNERYAEILQERFDRLPLKKIYVQLEDSLQAGNCEAHSIKLKQLIGKEVNAVGDFAARADQILEFRDDDLAKRAIVRAYINHYQ